MRVVICCSPSWNFDLIVQDEIVRLHRWCRQNEQKLLVIYGGEPGPETVAEKTCVELGIDLSFYTINPDTGAGTLVGTINANIPPAVDHNINGLDFHPITGQLFGSSINGDTENFTSLLVNFNETLPSVNIVGQTLNCFDGIVFSRMATGVPALSTWGIIALVAAFAIAGIFYIRRNRILA